MTTLQAIGTTLALGSCVGVVSIAAFGVAVTRRSTLVAPKATARPKNVIYNPYPSDDSQKRGNAWLGWIPWTLGLTYDTMLKGVPGTGTREDGLSGSMLRLNLDGIVLLRFHAFCRRVVLFATFLFVVLLLPIFFTSQCYNGHGGELVSGNSTTNETVCESAAYSNYIRTTIANIPGMSQSSSDKDYGILERLYITAFVFWVVVGYTLHLLNQEWIQILAMRRVYYLEYDVWGERRRELKETLLFDYNKKQHRPKRGFSFDSRSGSESVRPNRSRRDTATLEPHLVNREPWIPHPEQRDTVPNVALYSLLVGGLPSLPESTVDDIDPEATINFSKRESIDWQLSLTAAFFDHCVPNQPGFSSSVAAVTIIPGANEMTHAWRKWYAAASKLRRLRFIRKQIAERRHYEIELEEDSDDDEIDPETPPDQLSPESEPAEETPRQIYRGLSKKKSYFRQVLGSVVDDAADEHVYEAVTFGPEQTAVYSREFAQAAAPCCPNGCREDRVRAARIDELLDMEREAAAAVHDANLALNEIRHKIAVSEPMEENPPADTDDDSPAISVGRKRLHSLEGARVPGDLGLEAKIYKKGAAKSTPMLPVKSDQTPSSQRNLPREGANASMSADQIPSSHLPSLAPTVLSPKKRKQSSDWELVESIIVEATTSERSRSSSSSLRAAERRIATGMWELPKLRHVVMGLVDRVDSAREWLQRQSAEAVDTLARDSTYAVVTFTSRQAAVAARNCLADGRATGRWDAVRELPIPPLADAAAGDLLAFRNCCRPVTVSVNERQKTLRRIIAYVMLATIYIFYTVPLTAAQGLVSPTTLDTIFPQLIRWAQSNGFNLSGILSSLIVSAFFASCPVLFKAISNFGSGAHSVARAEYHALQYYWWFMVVTAFSSNLLVSMTLNALNNNLEFGSEFRKILRSIAQTIPGGLSSLWLNWIIFRFTITIPLNYILNINVFLFKLIGMECCARLSIGGGPGGPTPYRIYVDSGVVLMCTLALAPQSPLVALASLVYFLIFEPVLRRNLIFAYRPKFDGGGGRWTFICDMILSGLVVGLILLVTQMALKATLGPAIVSAVPIIPIVLFKQFVNRKYVPAFTDAALLQTSLLDGWDVSEETSVERREEFRRFLVDAHKAAYVPVCIAGSDTNGMLTAEPALVVPLESEIESPKAMEENGAEAEESVPTPELTLPDRRTQHGATLRRAVGTLQLLRKRNASRDILNTSLEDIGLGDNEKEIEPLGEEKDA